MAIFTRSGLGRNLTPAEADETIETLVAMIEAVEASAVTGVGVTGATMVGSALTLYLSNGDTLGPFNIPTPRVPKVYAITGTSYTLATANIGQYGRATNAAGLTITVPTNDDVGIPVDSEYHFRVGPGCPFIVLVEGDTGVTINGVAGYDLAADTEGAVLTLKKVGTDEWDVFGHLMPMSA